MANRLLTDETWKEYRRTMLHRHPDDKDIFLAGAQAQDAKTRIETLKEVGRILRQQDRCSPDVKDFELRILPIIEMLERGELPGGK